MRKLYLIIAHRDNGKFASFVTPMAPEEFERDLRKTPGWRRARVHGRAKIYLSNAEVALIKRLLELSATEEVFDFDTFKNLLAKFGKVGYTMLPPVKSKRRQPRK